MEYLINLTPHVVKIYAEGGDIICTIPSSGSARCSSERKLLGVVKPDEAKQAIPIYQVIYGAVENIPETTPNTKYIVSNVAAQRLKLDGRVDDILVPEGLIRDSGGNILGCSSLARV